MTQGLLDLKRLYWNCRAFRDFLDHPLFWP
jgi:hypothetical protein